MPLQEDTLREIETQVRSGFESRERVIEIFCEEMYAPGDLDPDEVADAVDDLMERHERSKSTWPVVTDCDRLDRAFAGLEQAGIICLQNAGYTKDDGYDDFREALDAHPDRGAVRGYCYYHGQDCERAVVGGGLYLAFGPTDPAQEDVGGPAIGREIVAALSAEGFSIDWDGTFARRILIPKFTWQRR